ncbi:AAA family ATPase [Variovorax ginsengisoli]|uniref:ATP-binding protein n=1 Tax=Variovorax ginsengisoli TaxID=363844 RepID=A0ABT8SC15_9BURK|nr:ATP-binding protein [Variovorax ginsengisoli]MDN8617286.1 ATP-binding protein [Variovorax ginsengisoli]MDO1536456.1 ATP-binding protein [Variovorax ginsengisoli]
MLVSLKASRKFVVGGEFEHDGLAEFLGLQHWTLPSCDFDEKAVHAELRALHKAAERDLQHARAPAYLAGNVVRLATLAGLSDTDCRILEFVVLIQTDQLVRETANWLGDLSSVNLYFALAAVLGIPESDVRASLASRGTLARSGLVSMGRFGTASLADKLELLSTDFADSISSTDADPIDLLKDMVVPGSSSVLALEDYAHIGPSLSILRPYLKHALESNRTGVNVFLHGAPGTGKSQLARLLAQEFECELFEVTSEDDDGDPVGGERRLRAFRAAQSFFSQRRSLILFDEVEDVFNDGDVILGRRGTVQSRKGWLNRMLEENKVPTLWLSNAIHTLDAAFIRRFDMVIELPVPPRAQRERILRHACGELLAPDALKRLADSESLAPAVVTRAAAVVHCIQGEILEGSSSEAIERLIEGTLEAQGHRTPKRAALDQLPPTYEPSLVNADTDLVAMASGLVRTRAGRICLYGPPGTGKTAYGRWLAERIGVPLMIKRASDLMSKWVGGSEKNIARAFRSAEEEGAVLLIDEVDSFLQDRRHARASWEVSQVNELLTQMECFGGVFIASTNLVRNLDQAALRRFDLKIKLDFLKPEQAARLLGLQCAALGLGTPTPAQLSRVTRLIQLTPGDFAAIARRSRFHPIASVDYLLVALEAECAMKEAGARSVLGFLA